MPLGVGRGRNVGLRDFCHNLTLLPPGASVFHKHMSSCNVRMHGRMAREGTEGLGDVSIL